MPCRVGITTNIKERKLNWQLLNPTLKNWRIIGGPMSRNEAQAMETRQAKAMGCYAHPGGNKPDDPMANFWVYFFEY